MKRACWLFLALWALAMPARGEVVVTMSSNSYACANDTFTIRLADNAITRPATNCGGVTYLESDLRAGLEPGRTYTVTAEGAICSAHLFFAVPGCYKFFINGVEGYAIHEGTTNSPPGSTAGSWQVEVRHERLLSIDFDVPKVDDRFVLAADGVSVAHPSIKSVSGSTALVAPLTWSIVSEDKLDCQIDATNGTVRAGEREGTLLIKVIDSSVPPCQVLEELDLRKCVSCEGESCTIGSVSAELGSVAVRVNLGRGFRGEFVGALGIYSTNPAANFGASSLLRYPFRRNGVEPITNAAGVLQQVRVPQGLVVVQPGGASSYSLLFYRPEHVLLKVNGLYQLTGDPPFASVSLSVPVANSLLVASSVGQPWLYRALAGSEWTLTSGLESVLSTNGVKIEKLKTVWSGAGNSFRTVTRTIMNGQGQTNTVSSRAYRKFTWGEPLEEEVLGVGATALTNRYLYSTDGRRLETTLADGGWSIEFFDTRGRVTERYSAFADQTATTNKLLCRFTESIYATSVVPGSGDLGRISTNTPRRVTEFLLGTEVARRYEVFRQVGQRDEHLSIVCLASNAAWNHSSNLVTTRVAHHGGEFHGTLLKTILPDGTIETYEYAANRLLQTLARGQPQFTGSDVVSDGARVVTELTPVGALLTRTNFDVVSSAITGQEIFSEHDDYGRPRQVTYLDGTSTYTEFGCCGPTLEVDRDGATTTYTYDALRRRHTESMHGLVYRVTNDAADRVLARLRQGTDGTLHTNASHAYDWAGRLTNSWNALGQPARFHETNAPGRRVTTTYADGGARVEEFYRDGQPKRETGTATFPRRFEYGVTNGSANGVNCALSWRKEIKLTDTGADTPEWILTLADPAGREVKTLYAAPPGQPVPASEWVFNAQGQLSKEIDPDGVTTLHLYNARGEPRYRVLDANRNGAIDWSATNGEQIVETLLSVTAGPGETVRRAQTSVTAQDGSPTLTTVAATETSLDGLRVWQTLHGQTTYAQTTYAGNVRTVLVVAPDGTTTTSTYVDGRLASVQTHHPVLNETLRALDYTYDAHGRLAGIFDHRTGLTTNVFDAADQRVSVTLPASNVGEAPLTTSFQYDPVGRESHVFLPDGGVVARSYYSNGLPRLEQGARVYPSEQRYDAQGRLSALLTWTNFATLSGAATNQWHYDAYRGWLTNRVFAGSNGVFYSYTNSGRLALRRWARGLETRYGYDALGQPSVANHSDATPDVFFTRDRLGRPRRLEERGPTLTNVTLLTNHLAGHLLSEARAGVLVTNGYDARFRRTRWRLSTSLWNDSITYGYDDASRLRGVTNSGYAAEYIYQAGSSLVAQTLGWDLNAAGGPAARLITEPVRDALDRLTSLPHRLGSSAIAASYAPAYNAAGQRTAVTNADGSRWDYSYDALGQVTAGHRRQAGGAAYLGQQFDYGFDDIGNRRYAALNGQPQQLGMNLMNQLTQRTLPGVAVAAGRAAANATVTVNHQPTLRQGDVFHYEAGVNNSTGAVWLGLTNVAVINPATPGAPDIVTSNTATAYVPMTPQVFTCDADGNRTSDARWTNRWDAENRLVEQESLSSVPPAYRQKLLFSYDWQGRRMSKVVSNWNVGAGVYQLSTSERFVYDGWKLISVLTSNLAPIVTHVWGLDLAGQQDGKSLDAAGGVGGLLLSVPFAGRPIFCAADLQGNVTTLIDALDGTITGRFEYAPFGELLRATGPAAAGHRLRFSTKYEDAETGLYYYGHRYYDPVTGRWPNRDPIGEIGGFNLYGMVDNDPVNLVDPAGLHPEPHDDHVSGKLQHTDISLNSILPFGDFNSPVTWKGTLFWRKVCCGKKGSKSHNVGQSRYIATLPEFKPSVDAQIEVTAVKTWVKNWVRKKVNKKLQHLVDLIDIDANVALALNGKFHVHYDGCAESIRVRGAAGTRITGTVGGSVHLGTQDDYAAAGLKGSVTGAGVLYGKGVNSKVEIFLQKNASIDVLLSGYGKLVVAKNPVLDESFKETFNVYKSAADVSVVSFDVLDYVK